MSSSSPPHRSPEGPPGGSAGRSEGETASAETAWVGALLPALLRLDGLGRLPRTGWLQAGIPSPESVAAHTAGVAFLALALAERESPPVDPERALALALLHDAPEALLTDLPRTAARLLPEGVKRAAEARAGAELLAPFGPAARALFEETHARETRAARFVALCDRLHLGLQLVHHARTGRRGLDDFERGLVALDCGEFAACAALRAALLAALDQARTDAHGAGPAS